MLRWSSIRFLACFTLSLPLSFFVLLLELIYLFCLASNLGLKIFKVSMLTLRSYFPSSFRENMKAGTSKMRVEVVWVVLLGS
jgi:hypothetical protein